VAASVCRVSSAAPTASEPAEMKSLRVCMASPKSVGRDSSTCGPAVGLKPDVHARPAAVQGDALTRDVACGCAQQKFDGARQLVQADELPFRHRLGAYLFDPLRSRPR